MNFLRVILGLARRTKNLARAVRKDLLLRKHLLLSSAIFKKIEKGGISVKLLQQLAPDSGLVLEVGANSGQDTVLLLDAFPVAEIWCFEPEPRALKSWQKNVKDPRAKLFPIAVADFSGTVSFHQSDGVPPDVASDLFPDGWDLSGSIMRPKNHTQVHPWSSFENTISVRCEPLDSIIGNPEDGGPLPIGLLWADVQGAEELLIRGANETLKKTRYFYTEFSNDELYEGQVSLAKLISLLPHFRIKKLWKNDVLFENRAILDCTKKTTSNVNS
jgi:FkbM family methyltransferase